MRRLLLVALLALPTLALGGGASADCAGPSIAVQPTSGSPGDAITVTGQAWGTNCYDTGPPPAGEGPLGLPQTGIEVVFVDAEGTVTPLATVDADAEYRFELDAVVPADAAAGSARVAAASIGAAFTVAGGAVPATPAFTG